MLKNMLKKYFLFLFSLIFVTSNINAQELDETLQQLSGDAAKAYLSPVTNGFGANLNTGWVSRSPKAELWGVNIQLGLVGMGAFMSDENKSFTSTGAFRFSQSQAEMITSGINNAQARNAIISELTSYDQSVVFSGATVVGAEDDNITISFPDKFEYNGTEYGLNDYVLPVGGLLENLSVIPLTAPQLTLGTVYGTQISIRYLPEIQLNEEIGNLTYLGFGIQHNVGMWIPVPLPVDVSVGYFTQNLKVGELLETSASEFGAYASKTFGPGMLNVTPYAGISYQTSSLKASYNFIIENNNVPVDPINVTFEAEGENTAKLTLGAAFKLGFFNLNVDYNMAKYSTVGAGIGFIF